MLRITVQDTPNEVTLKLEGSLAPGSRNWRKHGELRIRSLPAA
jgi:hypothetical protein